MEKATKRSSLEANPVPVHLFQIAKRIFAEGVILLKFFLEHLLIRLYIKGNPQTPTKPSGTRVSAILRGS
jgi:hypothetical protein